VPVRHRRRAAAVARAARKAHGRELDDALLTSSLAVSEISFWEIATNALPPPATYRATQWPRRRLPPRRFPVPQ
jgi:hypothetical protein